MSDRNSEEDLRGIVEFPGVSALQQELNCRVVRLGIIFLFFLLVEDIVSELTIGGLVRPANLNGQRSTFFFFFFSLLN